MIKIAVVGANGMLGRDICRAFSRIGEVIPLDIDEIDITKRDGTIHLLQRISPDLIINSAVLVDVDACEKNPAHAWQVNAVGAQNLAKSAALLDCELIYISTDYVFDGASSANYSEEHTTHPINHYGKSKLAGELLSQALCKKLYIVRTSWLFGMHANSYVARILHAAAHGVVRMPVDQLEAPTYTRHLTHALCALQQSGCYGTYHVSGGDGVTRVEFAQYVLQVAQKTAKIETMSPAEVQQSRNAIRPLRVVLDCRLYPLVTNNSLPDWRAGVDEYIRNGGVDA